MIVVLGAMIVGMSLGMLGSGGSALTVPVLVYIVGHGTRESIAESMAIVGLISLVAAVPYARSREIDWRSVVYFGVPGMLGTFVGAWMGGLAAEALQLVVFGGILIVAAYAMFRSGQGLPRAVEVGRPQPKRVAKIAVDGTVVGVVTGFVGVGGGFLIVPALVVLGRLPMRLAVGTSLAIISIKAAVGFLKYEHDLIRQNASVDGGTILIFVIVGVVGSLIGRQINQRCDQRQLKQVFAVFLVLIGCFVVVHEGRKLTLAAGQFNHAVAAQPTFTSPATLGSNHPINP